MSFERPAAALLLFGLGLVIALLLWARKKRRESLQALIDIEGSAQLVTPTPLWRQNLSVVLFSLTWLACVIAIMGPKSPGKAPPPGEGADHEIVHLEEGEVVRQGRRPFHDVIILLDASASMAVSDTRVGLSRLEYAKEIADELISRLNGQSVALFAFTSEPTPLLPPTIDYLYSRLLLRGVRINEGDVAGTDFAEALDGVARAHFRSDEKKARTLIVLTDGGDTNLEQAEGSERERQLEALLSRVRGVDHLRTFCIGLGSREGEEIPGITYNGAPVRSSLDESFLGQLSREGGGSFLFANDYSALTLVDYLIGQMERGEQVLVDEEVALQGRVRRSVPPQRPPEPIHHDRPFIFLALLALFTELLLPPRIELKKEVPCAS